MCSPVIGKDSAGQDPSIGDQQGNGAGVDEEVHVEVGGVPQDDWIPMHEEREGGGINEHVEAEESPREGVPCSVGPMPGISLGGPPLPNNLFYFSGSNSRGPKRSNLGPKLRKAQVQKSVSPPLGNRPKKDPDRMRRIQNRAFDLSVSQIGPVQ
ncbi:hypothetical protein Hanom_Chr00s013789g01751511 [Helianthus anomalus]